MARNLGTQGAVACLWLAMTAGVGACGSEGGTDAEPAADTTTDIGAANDTAGEDDTGGLQDASIPFDAGPPADAGCPLGTPCDDGEPCTFGDHCDANGNCKAGLDMCACRKDADCDTEVTDRCRGTAYCDVAKLPYRCRINPGTVVVCDPSKATPCTGVWCDPTKGECATYNRPTGTPCQDGDPCSVDDTCKDGGCAAGPATKCQCQDAKDCAELDDGDPCNGTIYCAKTVFPYVCATNKASIISCPASTDPCKLNACAPKTGGCVTQPAPDFTLCDDGKVHTVGDVCIQGECQGSDSGFCSADKDCGVYEDGDQCNGTLFCNKAEHKCAVNAATKVSCATANDTTCTANLCQPTTGNCVVVAIAEGQPCNDGDSCSSGDHCKGGGCVHTADTCLCDTNAGCEDKQGDGDLCNGTLFCDKSLAKPRCKLNPATKITCPTGGLPACRSNVCQPKTGVCELADAATNTACDDGDKCTEADVCDGGACAGTFTCTCKADKDCEAEDDGNLCNGTMFCDKSGAIATCKPNKSTVVKCPTVDDTACLRNICRPKTGACKPTAVEQGGDCEDGNPCTKADVCEKGQCVGVQTCECQTTSDCAAKEDGDLCNGTLYCDKLHKWPDGALKPACVLNPATLISCPKSGDACLNSVCNPATGLCQAQPANDSKPCNDGDLCTTDDACKLGACSGLANKACDDSDKCTLDDCDPKKGCVFLAKGCSDGNVCTADNCDKATGKCAFKADAVDGNVCNLDDNGCTVNDTCVGGTCKVGFTPICHAETGPCEQSSCASTGAQSFKCVAVPKKDGTSCDDGQGCYAGATCKAGKCNQGDVAKLWEKVVAPMPTAGNGGSSVLRRHRLRQVMPWDDGDLLLFGTAFEGTSSQATTQCWVWFERRDTAGKSKWEQKVLLAPFGKYGRQCPTFFTAARSGKDEVQLLTAHSDQGGQTRAVVRASDGKVLSSKTAELNPWILAFIARSDGTFTLAAGSNSAKYVYPMKVWRMSTYGTLSWQVDVQPTSQQAYDQFPAGGVDAGAGDLVVGYSHYNGACGPPKCTCGSSVCSLYQNHWPTAWRLDGAGNKIWMHQLAAGGVKGHLHDAIANQDGSFVAVGVAYTSPHRPYVVGIGASGDKQWLRVWSVGEQLLAVARAGGALVAGGSVKPGGKSRPWLAGISADGLPRWVHDHPASEAGKYSDVAAMPDGTFVAVGESNTLVIAGSSTYQNLGLLARGNAFGHVDCDKAGVCAAKTAKDCDDSKACTTDACDGKTGCTHTPVAGCTE